MKTITNEMLDGRERLSTEQEVEAVARAVVKLADALVDRGAIPADLPELVAVRRIAAAPHYDGRPRLPDPPQTSHRPPRPVHDAHTGALAPTGGLLGRLRGW